MSLRFMVDSGSGRARCKICSEIIKNTEMQVIAYGYQTQGSCHLDCLNRLSKT